MRWVSHEGMTPRIRRNIMAKIQIWDGVEAEVNGDKVTLTLTLRDLGPSKSGKTHTYCTTAGFKGLPNGMKVSLNVNK